MIIITRSIALRRIAAVLAALALCTTASAHHSFSMFDRERTLVISGVVKEFQWTNPHTWIQLTVTGADGRQV
jgi:hypothetical protein